LLSLNWNIGHGFKLNGQLSFSKQSDVTDLFLPPGHTAFAAFTPEDFFKRGTYNQTTSEFLSMEGALNPELYKKTWLASVVCVSRYDGNAN
jgi:hypothetical protein